MISKYILPPPTSHLTEIILTPISPETETCNESYVKSLNVRNATDYECMDQTDFTPSPRTPNQLTVDGGTSLQKVFCCAQNGSEQSGNSGTSGGSKAQQQQQQSFSNKPGYAVQIFESAEMATAKTLNVNTNSELITDKVGPSASTSSNPSNTTVNRLSTNVAHEKRHPPPLPSPPKSPALNSNDLKLDLDEEEDMDMEKLRTGRRDSQARVSPSKSYSELVQFVFTEHGIKVISDREYVV